MKLAALQLTEVPGYWTMAIPCAEPGCGNFALDLQMRADRNRWRPVCLQHRERHRNAVLRTLIPVEQIELLNKAEADDEERLSLWDRVSF